MGGLRPAAGVPAGPCVGQKDGQQVSITDGAVAVLKHNRVATLEPVAAAAAI
jgi:hypothetical protein